MVGCEHARVCGTSCQDQVRARGRTPASTPDNGRSVGGNAASYMASMSVTWLVSHCPMSWLKARATSNLRVAQKGGRVRAIRHGKDRPRARGRPQGAPGTNARTTRAARPANPSREPAGRPCGVQRRQATYMDPMFATRVVSQSARLLLKSFASRNMVFMVVADDTSQLATSERANMSARGGGAHAHFALHAPCRLPPVPAARG